MARSNSNKTLGPEFEIWLFFTFKSGTNVNMHFQSILEYKKLEISELGAQCCCCCNWPELFNEISFVCKIILKPKKVIPLLIFYYSLKFELKSHTLKYIKFSNYWVRNSKAFKLVPLQRKRKVRLPHIAISSKGKKFKNHSHSSRKSSNLLILADWWVFQSGFRCGFSVESF